MIVDKLYNCFLQILNMSYIIDQLDSFLSTQNNTINFIPPPSVVQLHTSSSKNLNHKVEITKALGKVAAGLIASELTPDRTRLSLFLNNIFGNISIILDAEWKTGTGALAITLRLLSHEAKPLRVPGSHRRLLLCKLLASRHNCPAFRYFKMTVSMLNGEVRLLSALAAPLCTSYDDLGTLLFSFVKLLSENRDLLHDTVGLAREVCWEGAAMQQEELRRQADQRVKQLYYYSQFTSVAINLSLESTNDEKTIIRKQQKQMESIQRLKTNYVSLRNRNGLQLYALSDFSKPRSEVANFQISQIQREDISENTAPPTTQRARNPHDYVLNYVRIRNKQDRTMRRLHQSNFTYLYLKVVEYSYVGSYNASMQSDAPQMQPHRKAMVVKREKNTRRSRIAHEKMILTKIKDGMSLFLPKYYISIDRNDSQNELMLDYIEYPNLGDFVKQHKDSLSYQTKIYFGYIIAQGLRYLQEYQIAHLDLKPANIMLHKKLMIKFIDFGESYHPNVKNHQPGFSVPYSAPENHNSPAKYSHKNDIFSLGVILYELFLGKFPFYFYDNQRRQEAYRKGNVSNYWFCSPEENLSFGESTIFPILQVLIGKCLSSNPQERPELEWVVLILRKCLDYLY